MKAHALQARLSQAFMRGYHDRGALLSAPSPGNPPLSSQPALHAVHAESRELRRSIDACRDAMSQMSELPPPEQEQLRTELRTTLEHLATVSDQLLGLLRPPGTAPGDAGSPLSATAPDPLADPSGRSKRSPRRR